MNITGFQRAVHLSFRSNFASVGMHGLAQVEQDCVMSSWLEGPRMEGVPARRPHRLGRPRRGGRAAGEMLLTMWSFANSTPMVTGMVKQTRRSAFGLVALLLTCLAIMGAVPTTTSSDLLQDRSTASAENPFQPGIAVFQGAVETSSAVSSVLPQSEAALRHGARDLPTGRFGFLFAVIGATAFLLRNSRRYSHRIDRPAAPPSVAGCGQSGRGPPFAS